MFPSLVDMALTPPEVKEEIAERSMPAPSPSVSAYPWGLCLRIEDETLAKLGLDGDLPDVGQMMHFVAVARVTSASQREDKTGDGATKVHQCVELQITSMAVASADLADMAADAAQDRRRRLYGTGAEAA